ncbi:hypothetical protein JMUB6875_77150 [Nocardia sp. JMUB6875]|uniref:hypothetical protein n=1 Tax=Nocardia sp. JMUB6875 TaxID=3158170 RepID=UPI0032E5CC3A
MKRIRGLAYAPLWVIVLAAAAAQLGYSALVDLGWPGVVEAAILTPLIAYAVQRTRRRFGGRHEMRRFHEALRAGELPTLTSADEIVRWNQMIVHERKDRQERRVLAWMLLPLGALYLVISVWHALIGRYTEGLAFPAYGVLMIAVFAWTLRANPRILAALTTLAEQGTERGYGR